MPSNKRPYRQAVQGAAPEPQFEVYSGAECLLSNIQQVGWSRHSQAVMSGLVEHAHPGAFEICYIVAGTASWWVANDFFEVRPGDVFVTWPDERHGGVDSTMHPCELYWAIFELPELNGRGSDIASTSVLRRNFGSLSCRLAKGGQECRASFERLMAEYRSPCETSSAAVQSALQLLIVDAVRACQNGSDTGDIGRREHSPKIEKAITWMNANIGERASVDIVARQAGLRASHFRHQFRKETGFSPKEFLMLLRVREAKNLLVNTSLSITDIAYALGFRSSQYFATAFRRSTGLSPRHYRESRAKLERL